MNRTMKRYFWILAAALVSLAACDKNELQNGKEEGPNSSAVAYIRAIGGDDASKANIDNDTAAFTWSAGDTIAVYTSTAGYILSEPLSIGAGTNNATFKFSGDKAVTAVENRADFAVFPAGLVYIKSQGAFRTNSVTNHDASNLTVTLRSEYALSEVSGDKAPTPMIATNTPGSDLSFKALCPLIRIAVKNIPPTTKLLEFEFEGRKVNGEFSISSVVPGTTYLTGTASSGYYSKIKVVLESPLSSWGEVVVNLPVPVNASGYPNVVVRALDMYSSELMRLDSPLGSWSPTRKSSKKHTAAFPVFSFDGKKGVFAPANLQAKTTDGSTWTWQFADNEYDVIGKAVANTKISGKGTVSENGTVDLFGWSTDNANNYYGINNSMNTSHYTGTFKDWGGNVISGWRTPTAGDWAQVFEHRTGTNRFAKARVHSTAGIILFPDGFEIPSGITIANINVKDAGITLTEITDSNWAILKQLGCVFLPGGGSRYGSGEAFSGENSYNSNLSGYWSSTKNAGTTIYIVYFGSTPLAWTSSTSNNIVNGYSVRLVRDLNF